MGRSHHLIVWEQKKTPKLQDAVLYQKKNLRCNDDTYIMLKFYYIEGVKNNVLGARYTQIKMLYRRNF